MLKKKIINDVSFYNLRLKNGELIKNEGFKLSKIITDYIFKDLSNFPEFKKINNKIKNEYFINFLRKEIFYQVLPIANQIIIINTLINNNINKSSEDFIIELSNFKKKKNFFYFFCNHYNAYLLSFITKKHSGKIIFKNSTNFYKILYFFLKSTYLRNNIFFKIYKKIIYKKYNSIFNNNKKAKIAVTYGEGIDTDKRSDLYWYDDQKFDADQIIVYFESKNIFKQEKSNIKLLYEKKKN